MSLDQNNKEIRSPEHQIINNSNVALTEVAGGRYHKSAAKGRNQPLWHRITQHPSPQPKHHISLEEQEQGGHPSGHRKQITRPERPHSVTATAFY